ncbi:hypothetical protein AMTRI_Chr03g141890 [Amborella trichopoda]
MSPLASLGFSSPFPLLSLVEPITSSRKDPFGLSSGIFRPMEADGLHFLVLPAIPSPLISSPVKSTGSSISVDTMGDPLSPPPRWTRIM